MSGQAPESVYGVQEYVETIERYCGGGYHPVRLGDAFSDGRYRVVHKLGWGSYSTVWLAKDQYTNFHVALKIIVGQEGVSTNESRILRLLKQHHACADSPPGAHFVSELLDEFIIDGPNGPHVCLVIEPAACSVADSKEGGIHWQFPLKAAREIAAKVIMGMDFIHRAGIVHGDLHTRNIFFKISNVDRLSTGELYQRLHPPKERPIERIDKGPLGVSVPPYAVEPLWIGEPCEHVTNTELMIADFGEAYIASEKTPQTLNTPVILCPPEALLKIGTIGMPADIWALACAIFEILGDRVLFECWPDPDATLTEIVSAIGQPSETLWKAWQNRHEHFNEDGSWKPSKRGRARMSRPLDVRIAQMRRGDQGFTEAEQDALLQLLKGMLTWDPEERFTIADVVQSEWMEKFGKPAIATPETESSPQPATEIEKPAEGALGIEVSLPSSTEAEKPAEGAFGIEVSLPSSTEAEKSPKEDLLEESKDFKIGRSLQTSTEMKKSSYENLLEESKDLRIERLETPMELPRTEREKRLNEDILVEAKDPEAERIEIPETPSHIEIEKSHSKVSLEEVRDVKVETLAKSE
ncbi:MAG: hypothetical protein Q9185_000443 [Variospora sp. 1 TL-2023]